MLDTDTCSAAIKGQHNIDERLSKLDPADICISAITRSEIRYGVALRPEATRLSELANAFLAFVRVEPWDAVAADRHGDVRAHLRQHGTPIGAPGEMIAAHALSLGAILVTNNEKHFGHVPGLRIENWIRGH
jgi:tRNA(fMet)-specific endonuclease VapC